MRNILHRVLALECKLDFRKELKLMKWWWYLQHLKGCQLYKNPHVGVSVESRREWDQYSIEDPGSFLHHLTRIRLSARRHARCPETGKKRTNERLSDTRNLPREIEFFFSRKVSRIIYFPSGKISERIIRWFVHWSHSLTLMHWFNSH